MIEEVVNSILEAEDVAQKKIAEAKQEANSIVTFAETEADKFKKQSSSNNKAIFAEKSRQIDVKARDGANQVLANLNAQTDKEMANYQKNVDAAVKIILEQFR